MAEYFFKRYELKYLLGESQYEAVKSEIEKRLSPDEYGKTSIQSIYYDTENFRLVRESIEKPVFKEKLRLRCYNLNDDDRDIYVEMKRKYDGVVYKRRIACKESEIEKLFAGGFKKSQIGRELDYFLSFYGSLKPKMLIIYDREAYFEKGGDLRVTFDKNVRYRTEDLNFHTSLAGESLLSASVALLELKTAAALPLWLCETLCREGVKKQSFSKYGGAYEREYLNNEYLNLNKRRENLCSNRFSAAELSPQQVSLSL